MYCIADYTCFLIYIYIGMIFFFENNKNNVKIINCCFYASSADKVRSTF